MKFDFEPNFVQSVLNFLQEAPVPHKFIDPMLKLIVSQSTDPRIQSLAYPQEPKAEVSEGALPAECWHSGANPQEPTRAEFSRPGDPTPEEVAWLEPARQAKTGGG